MTTQTKMERYEDAYKDAWGKQVEIDRAKQLVLRKPYHNHHNRAVHAANGRKGGAPRLQLTKEGEVFNRMLANGMSEEEITHIMGVDPKHVGHVVKRFKLPRTE